MQQCNKYVMNKLELSESEWKSLYIRVIPVDLIVDGELVNNESSLKNLIETKLRLGKVERIDFSERKNHKGDMIKSAYVHFFMWDNMAGKNMRFMIDQHGSARVNGYFNELGAFTPFAGQWHNGAGFGRFIEFKKNINPISQSKNEDMNIQQLIMKCKQYEERVSSLFEKVNTFIDGERQDLTNIIKELKDKDNKMDVEERDEDNKMDVEE